MDVGAPLVADGQAPVAVEPGQACARRPSGGDPAARWSRCPCGRCGPGCGAGAGPGGSAGCRRPCRHAAWPGACAAVRSGCRDRRDGIEQVLEDDGVVAVGAGQEAGERDAGRGRPQHGASCPVCRDPSGSGRRRRPPFGRDAGRVQDWPGSSRCGRLRRGDRAASWCSRVPDPGLLPVAQAAPAGHAGAAAHLLGQHLPGDAGLRARR